MNSLQQLQETLQKIQPLSEEGNSEWEPIPPASLDDVGKIRGNTPLEKVLNRLYDNLEATPPKDLIEASDYQDGEGSKALLHWAESYLEDIIKEVPGTTIVDALKAFQSSKYFAEFADDLNQQLAAWTRQGY